MFYEKESAHELFDSKNDEQHSFYLLTAMFDKYEHLTENEFILLSVKWNTKAKKLVHKEDKGIILNTGNILVLIDNDNKAEFLERISKQAPTTHKKASACVDVLEIRKDEINQLQLY